MESDSPSIGSGQSLVAVTTLALIWAMPARSLDFASELLVYQEDCQGEFTYPTTPKVNVGLLTLSRSRIRQSSDSPHAL